MKTGFVDKLKIQIKKHVLVENKLTGLSKKFKTISIKALTKDLMNKNNNILNEAKYFYSRI